MYTTLEKADFLNNPETKEICDNTLLNFYSLEGRLRYITFDTPNDSEDDKNLSEAATRISLNSLHSLNAST